MNISKLVLCIYLPCHKNSMLGSQNGPLTTGPLRITELPIQNDTNHSGLTMNYSQKDDSKIEMHLFLGSGS